MLVRAPYRAYAHPAHAAWDECVTSVFAYIIKYEN